MSNPLTKRSNDYETTTRSNRRVRSSSGLYSRNLGSAYPKFLATMVIVFDTETNGLPANYKAPMTDLDNWPRVVQLAWAVFNEEGQQVRGQQHIIKPDGWTIPEEAAAVHGITQEVAEAEGAQIFSALALFLADYYDCHTLVAHNLDFDYRVLGAEMIRTGVKSGRRIGRKVCTMQASTDFCALPGNYGKFKWPKLEELHEILFAEKFDGAHEAMVDVLACGRCYFELLKRGIIQN